MTGRKFPSHAKLGKLLGDPSILDELALKDQAKEEEEKKENNIEKLNADKDMITVNSSLGGKKIPLSQKFPKWTFMEAIESLKLPKPVLTGKPGQTGGRSST
jgi:hypothetical protein